jgi:hypothetical protein
MTGRLDRLPSSRSGRFRAVDLPRSGSVEPYQLIPEVPCREQ